jgi:hypothetical protein
MPKEHVHEASPARVSVACVAGECLYSAIECSTTAKHADRSISNPDTATAQDTDANSSNGYSHRHTVSNAHHRTQHNPFADRLSATNGYPFTSEGKGGSSHPAPYREQPAQRPYQHRTRHSEGGL